MPHEFTIDEGDTVRTLASKNGVPRQTWTGAEFRDFVSRMKEKFPDAKWEVGTKYDHRETTGDDFFLVMHRDNLRRRAFIVKKG